MASLAIILLFIVYFIHYITGQECDCFQVSLNQIYEYRPASDIYCYEYYVDQCRPVTEIAVTFHIDNNECYLNGLELADVIVDTNPDIWDFKPADDTNPPGVTFDIPGTQRSIIEICIDGTRAFLAEALLQLVVDDEINCQQIFFSNPSFCGSYDCDVNPTCYCFDERELCENAPAEFGKICLWNENEQRCDAFDEKTTTTPTPETTSVSETPDATTTTDQ
eukprot:UN13095